MISLVLQRQAVLHQSYLCFTPFYRFLISITYLSYYSVLHRAILEKVRHSKTME